jgi:transposase InsO family protein
MTAWAEDYPHEMAEGVAKVLVEQHAEGDDDDSHDAEDEEKAYPVEGEAGDEEDDVDMDGLFSDDEVDDNDEPTEQPVPTEGPPPLGPTTDVGPSPRMVDGRRRKVLLSKGAADQLRAGHGMEHQTQKVAEHNAEVARHCGADVFRDVKHLHNNIGHPSSEKLAEYIKTAGGSNKAQECARLFICEVCLANKRPAPHNVSRLVTATKFKQAVSIDAFTWTVDNNNHLVLVMIDEATRYLVAKVIPNEQARTIIQTVEEMWIKWAGRPGTIKIDELRAHCSKEFLEWCERHDIKVDMIGGEQSWYLGVVGRHQEVFRQMLTKYHAETTDDPDTCVLWCQAAKNQLPRVKGFSFEQWVLAAGREVPTSLTDDKFNLAVHSHAMEDKSFEERLGQSSFC